MKLIYMGTPDFAVPALERLIEDGHEVALVVTQPDKPVGRKQILTPPAVKVCAQAHGLPVYQPTSMKTDECYEELGAIGADAIIVVAYGKILPKRILDLTRTAALTSMARCCPAIAERRLSSGRC